MSAPAGRGLAGGDGGAYVGDAIDVAGDADADHAMESFLARCAALHHGASSPFHAPAWLRAWYAALAGVDGWRPLLVGVRHRTSGHDAMLLPLVCRRRAGLRSVAFADAGVVDYVLPIVAPNWQHGLAEDDAARQLWRAVRQALRGHDVFVIRKMLPAPLDDAAASPPAVNPLTRVLRTARSDDTGHQFTVAAGWDAWRFGLDKTVRKELERKWRVFERSPAARFEQITDEPRAMALFDTLEQQQSARMHAALRDTAVRYRLDDPAYRNFYRRAIAGGLADGQIVLTALFDGAEVVSALFGVANRRRYIGLRQSIGGAAWMNCSPGQLLDVATSRHLHAQGRRHFDFGIGDYRHKAALGMTPIALVDACVALSWRGWPGVWHWHARRRLKRLAWLVTLHRRWRPILRTIFRRTVSAAPRASAPPG